jgi:hypothetical protein
VACFLDGIPEERGIFGRTRGHAGSKGRRPAGRMVPERLPGVRRRAEENPSRPRATKPLPGARASWQSGTVSPWAASSWHGCDSPRGGGPPDVAPEALVGLKVPYFTSTARFCRSRPNARSYVSRTRSPPSIRTILRVDYTQLPLLSGLPFCHGGRGARISGRLAAARSGRKPADVGLGG